MIYNKIIKKLFSNIENNNADKINSYFLENYDKLLKDCVEAKSIKLHFGCGPRVLKGWINIDLNFEPFEDYLKFYGDKYYDESVRGDKNDFYGIDITKLGLPFLDESVDVIFHEDFIEHLNQREQIIFLSETFRVLKRGQVHRINTPDLLVSMKKNSNFNLGRKGVYINEWDKHGHKNVLTKNFIEEMAYMVGYSKVIFNSRDMSVSKLIPPEYRPDLKDRSLDGNIFVDLIK